MNIYSIKDVALHTGISPITLRAWESRYGIIQPERTAGGHRMYSKEDIRRIKTILFLKSKGNALKNIPAILQQYDETNFKLHQRTIPRIIDGLKTLNASKIQKELDQFIALQRIETFADQSLPDILNALKQALWPNSIYFTQERCFFYDQLRFLLQFRYHQSVQAAAPLQIKIIGYKPPRELSEFYVQIYLLALLCSQYHYSSAVISHIDSFEEIEASCAAHSSILHIAVVGTDTYQLLQLLEKCKSLANHNLLIFHPGQRPLDRETLEKKYLLPSQFDELILPINQALNYTN